MLGPLTDQQKRDFFAGIDAFCMPSRTDSFGLVFLEAWANRKPVVGYRAGGVAELIHHGGDGLLVRCGEIDGLADALVMMERSDLRDCLGHSGYARLPVEFRWEEKLAMVETTINRLSGTTAPRGKPPTPRRTIGEGKSQFSAGARICEPH